MKKTNLLSLLQEGWFFRLTTAIRAERASMPLPVGFRIDLQDHQMAAADRLNKLYSKIVWGIHRSASNKKIWPEEKKIIEEVLATKAMGEKVLECGCGSGRLSRFLATRSRNVTFLDYNLETKVHLHSLLTTQKRCRFICRDLASMKGRDFSSVFLLENFVGMSPSLNKRIRLYEATYNNMKNGGIAVFGIRALDDLAQNYIYQAFPYSPRIDGRVCRLFGIAINWKPSYFLEELKKGVPGFRILRIVKGAIRPVGGYMNVYGC